MSSLYVAGSSSAKKISSLADLENQPFVVFGGTKHNRALALETKSGSIKKLSVQARFVVQDYTSMAKLVSMGAGFGLMPKMHLEHSSHNLRCILPKYFLPTGHISMVYPSRLLPRRVSLLIEHLVLNIH